MTGIWPRSRPAGVVAFGPSLIDICARLSAERYAACRRLLRLGTGGWRRLDGYRQVRALIAELTGTPVEPGGELDAIRACQELSVAAGSSTLGMITAMPVELRTRSTYVSVVGRVGERLDPLSELFIAGVRDLGIPHEYSVAEGRNPVGFVLSGTTDPERTLATYPGVAAAFDGVDLAGLSPDLVFVDTFELVSGAMAEFLHDMIDRGCFPVVLSLGDESLLTGALRTRIRAYLTAGKVRVLCGNAREYRALFPELAPDLTTPAGFRDHPVRHQAAYALVTFGALGMSTHCAGEFVSTRAADLDPATMVNTGGAGDAAVGAYCAGILTGAAPDVVLRQAIDAATRTTLMMHPQLLAGPIVESVRRTRRAGAS